MYLGYVGLGILIDKEYLELLDNSALLINP